MLGQKGKVTGMAMYDWNHDGKKDMLDDYVEYRMYQDSVHSNSGGRLGNHSSRGTGNGNLSTGAAIFCTVGGMLFSGYVSTCFPDMPAFLMVLLWFLGSGVLAAVCSSLKK